MTGADLGLAAVVGVIALVPAALAFVALAAGLRMLRAEARLGPVAFRAVTAALAAVVAAAAVLGAWTLGGATHLKPRCVARAEPVYPGRGDAGEGTPAPLPVNRVLVDAPDHGGAPPAWARHLLAPGGFATYEWRRADGSIARVGRDGVATPMPGATADAVLTVRRSATSASYWAPITVDRYELRERRTGTVLATGEEMWVDAGPARFRCGVASGPLPVRARDYPEGDGVARFLRRAVRPAD